MGRERVLVIGAGVSGLSVAWCLQERGVEVGIVARELSPDTTSDVAPAFWHPFKVEPVGRATAWARRTRERLVELAGEPASGVRLCPGFDLIEPGAARPWWAAAAPELAPAPPGRLPAGARSGWTFLCPVVESPIYLPWLLAEVRRRGATVEIRTLDRLEQAGALARVSVNCAGLGARELCRDPAVFASRGQIVQVDPLPVEEVWFDGRVPGEVTYVVPRADRVVLGATASDGDERLEPDEDTTRSILARAARLVPALQAAKPREVRVGLRPCRSALRLETERLAGGRVVVHNYGHGGAGYSLSWGTAEEAAGLVLAELSRPAVG